jgi:hypothetical protein
MWEAWQDFDPAAQAAIIAVVARTVVGIARHFGLDCRPGLESVLASAGVGAVAGYATSGWEGAVLGAVAGLAGTGLWEAQKQSAKLGSDRLGMCVEDVEIELAEEDA